MRLNQSQNWDSECLGGWNNVEEEGWVHKRLPFGSTVEAVRNLATVLTAEGRTTTTATYRWSHVLKWMESYGLTEEEVNEFATRLLKERLVHILGNDRCVFDLVVDSESLLIASIAPGLSFDSVSEIVAAARSYHGVPIEKRTYHLRSYPACFVASEFVTWISKIGIEMPRVDAVKIGQLLVDTGHMRHVVDREKPFSDDYLFFRFALDEDLVKQGKVTTARDFLLLEGGDGQDVPSNVVVPDAEQSRLESFLKREKSIEKVRVIIVGGGFAGSLCLHDLAESPEVAHLDVILIEPSDVFWYPLGAPRAVAVPDFAQRCCIPYAGLLRNRFGHVKHKAKVVDPKLCCVTLEDGRSLYYDIIFLATGSTSPMPGKHPYCKQKDILEAYQHMQKKVALATDVVIVGGGAVGVELAAEIASAYPRQKRVTIVNSSPVLLNDPKVLGKLRAKVEKALLEMGVRILHNDRLQIPVDLYAPQQKLVTAHGVAVIADVVLIAVGQSVNNGLVQEHFQLDDKGRLRVDRHLRVQGFKNVFCAGDLCDTAETKLGYLAALQGQLVAENILLLAKHIRFPLETHPLGVYEESTSTTMFVTLGPNDGVSQLPGGFVVGGIVSVPIKSRNLFLPRYWKTFHVAPPSSDWW